MKKLGLLPIILVALTTLVLGQGGAVKNKSAKNYFEDGVQNLNERSFMSAERSFKTCTSMNAPELTAECQAGLAEAYFQQSKFTEAFAKVNEAVKTKTSVTNLMLRAWMNCVKNNAPDLKTDLAELEKIFGKVESPCLGVRFVGGSLWETNELKKLHEEAKALADAALKDTNSQTVAATFQTAVNKYSEIINRYPANLFLYAERGKLYRELSAKSKMSEVSKVRTQAIDDYSRAIALSDKTQFSAFESLLARAELNLMVVSSTSNLNTALAAFQKAMGGGKEVTVTDGKGRSKAELIDLIVSDVTDALKISSGSVVSKAKGHYTRGKAYLLKDDKVNAANDFQQCLKMFNYQPARDELAKLGVITQPSATTQPTPAQTYRPAATQPVPQVNSVPAAQGTVESHYKRAEQLYTEGKFGDAETAINQALAINPNHIDSLAGRAKIYTALKLFNAAITDYTKIISIDPKSADAYYERSLIYVRLNDASKSFADLSTALNLNPKHMSALGQRAVYYSDKKQFDLAMNDANEVIKLMPNNAVSYNIRGQIYEVQTKFDLAIADYTKSISIDAKNTETFSRRGFCYNQLKKFNEAVLDLNVAMSLSPDNTYALYERAAAFSQLGKRDSAIADLRRILAIDPNIQVAKDALKQMGVQP